MGRGGVGCVVISNTCSPYALRYRSQPCGRPLSVCVMVTAAAVVVAVMMVMM